MEISKTNCQCIERKKLLISVSMETTDFTSACVLKLTIKKTFTVLFCLAFFILLSHCREKGNSSLSDNETNHNINACNQT